MDFIVTCHLIPASFPRFRGHKENPMALTGYQKCWLLKSKVLTFMNKSQHFLFMTLNFPILLKHQGDRTGDLIFIPTDHLSMKYALNALPA
jgi:hypothetical protein